MIKAEKLSEFKSGYNYVDGTEISLDALKEAIELIAEQYQIPIAFEKDQIKSGGFFNSEVMDCLVLYHPQHKNDYYKFTINIRRQGTMAFVVANYFGESKNLKKLEMKEAAKHNAVASAKYMILDADNSFKMTNALLNVGKEAVKGAMSLGSSKMKQEEENDYYSALGRILDEVFD